MLNPGQIFKAHQTNPLPIRNSTHIALDAFQNTSKSKWDQPITIPPILYSKFNVPIPISSKQLKLYPKSLLDYIKRSYDKCKDENQRNIMQKQLREIVRNFENDFNQINWQSYPLPIILQDGTTQKPVVVRNQEKSMVQPAKTKLNQIKLLSCYNIVEEEKPSKALEIAKKRTEKLQQKLAKLNKQENETESKKQFFIGFTSIPPPPPPVESKTSRFQSIPPPPSPSNPILTGAKSASATSTVSSSIASGVNGGRISQNKPSNILKYEINQKPTKKQIIKQKQIEKQKQKNLRKTENKQKKEAPVKQPPPKITKKELQMIGKMKEKDEQINQVARRFKEFNKLKSQHSHRDLAVDDDDDIDFDEVIVGKSQSIEKPYLRITGRPNPDIVRPESILKKALKHFIEKYNKDKNYEYFISQVRSIRQDLTVQHIKNGFTVHVYEQNLQISLYQKDIPQFKHCQTTLWQLYCQGHYYTKESRNKYIAHQMTTLIMQDKSQQMQLMLTRIPEGTLETQQVQQCLRLKRKLIMGNYRFFFDYYEYQNKFFKCLFDLYVDKMYIKFMLMICKTCGQKVPITSLCKILGEKDHKLQEILYKEGAIIENGFVMLKPSYDQLLKSEHLATKKVTVLMG